MRKKRQKNASRLLLGKNEFMPLGSDEDTLAELKVPEGYRLMVPLIFGYPVKDVQTAPPRDEDVVFNWIT